MIVQLLIMAISRDCVDRLDATMRPQCSRSSLNIGTIMQRYSAVSVKKLQFIHKLTASDTSKTAKITKR